MPMLDVSKLRVIEWLPGWHGQYFHSENITIAHYDSVKSLTTAGPSSWITRAGLSSNSSVNLRRREPSAGKS